MSNNTDFLSAQVRAARDLAANATLSNVRENHLRSAAAWEALANRSAKGDVIRAQEAVRKAERDAEAALAEDNQREALGPTEEPRDRA